MVYLALFFLTICAFPVLVMGPAGIYFESLGLRLALLGLLGLAGVWLLKHRKPETGWLEGFCLTVVATGTVYKLAAYIPEISTYPFSLSWSETSRYYYASLFFSERLYGGTVPLSVLHPSRYLMQAIPFLISGLPLWFHRLWQVLLWVIFAAATGYCLVKWLIKTTATTHSPGIQGILGSRTGQLTAGMWVFLFLFQGPVYYHLLVMVIVVLWGYERQNAWKTLVVVLAASLWAGISRINWVPVPGMLAAALYLLEQPARGKSLWRYLLWPGLWVILGSGAGLLSREAYMRWSGNPMEQFSSSFSSDLLWYRLFPSTTYPMGILLSVGLVSLPLVVLMLLRLIWSWRAYPAIRLLGLSAILIVLFAGGIVVSVKIGGGSNLHNLDAYLALLLVIGSAVYAGRFEPEPGTPGDSTRPYRGILAAAVMIPVGFAIAAGGTLPSHPWHEAEAALDELKKEVTQAAQEGGEVLFIAQRHLLTFQEIENVPLVAENELVFLMEMVMGRNTAYLEAFHQDLSVQRYALIVSYPQVIQYQGRAHQFGEENDAWVEQVSEPMLCYYEPRLTVPEVELQILARRAEPCK